MKAKSGLRKTTSGPVGGTVASYEAGTHPAAREDMPDAAQTNQLQLLPGALSKIWHAMPVWFINDNPVVGYKAASHHVVLLFWNGQSFAEKGLTAAGKFKAAQIKYTASSEIDLKALARWLRQAGKDIWDFRGLRRRYVDRASPREKTKQL